MSRPLVYMSLAFISGIVAGGLLDLPVGGYFVLLALLFMWTVSIGRREGGVYAGIPVMAIFLVLGVLWAELDENRTSRLFDDLNTHLYLSGLIVEQPRVRADRVEYVLAGRRVWQDGHGEDIDEKVLVVCYRPEGSVFSYGDLLEAYGRLFLPREARNPGEFDYRSYLARRGIFTRMVVTGPEHIRKVGEEPGNPLVRIALAWRGRVEEAITRAIPPREAGLLLGVLFGERDKIDDQDLEAWQTLGILHLLAVSGLHVGILIHLLHLLARLAKMGPWGLFSFCLAGSIFYAACAGFSPSVVRATIMGNMAVLALAVSRDYDFYTALSLAAVLILLFRPGAVYESGFQLSFAATWGIVYLYPLWDELLGRLPAWRKYIVVPLGAQLAAVPLSAYYFNVLPLIGLPFNILGSAVFGLVLPLGLVGAVLAPFFLPGAEALFLVGGGMVRGFLALVTKVSDMPGAKLYVPTPCWTIMGVGYVLLITCRELWVRRHKVSGYLRGKRGKLASFALLGGLILVVGARGVVLREEKLGVTFLDVGQGDAIYISTPGGKNLLIDAGGVPPFYQGDFEVGKEVVVPFLRRQGVSRLDMVISTHPDADHISGLFDVTAEIPTDLVLIPPPDTYYRNFLDHLSGLGLPWVAVHRGCRVEVEKGLTMEVLHPARDGRYEDPNEGSLVLRLCYGNTSFLFTGDVQEEGMVEMLTLGGQVRSDVLKVPHHGSRGGMNTAFISAVDPELAVISVGENNVYGHPSAEMVDFLEQAGILVFRTDRNGAVTVYSDGCTISVQPMIWPPGSPGRSG